MAGKLAVFHTIGAWRRYRGGLSGPGATVAFVPTMGALHEGHASLIRAARELVGKEGTVVGSVFVNPTQFGPNEDYTKYPRTLEADLALIEKSGGDAVFAPAPEQMYPPVAPGVGVGNSQGTMVTVEPGALGTVLEGAIRPGHFQGVCTVVCKLLGIVQPTKLVMGQKDFQQNVVLKAMIRDLNLPVEHVMCPTMREADGLAMSSRNRYLSSQERERAVALYEGLRWAKFQYDSGKWNAAELAAGMEQRIAARGLVVQYALAVHPETLGPWEGMITGPAVLLVAAKLGGTRLIDNMVLN